MNRKSIFMIIIILVIIVICCLVGFNQFFNQEHQITVGGTNFTIPQNYHEGKLNDNGDINLTNGSNSIFISHYGDRYVNKHMGDYLNYCYSQNNSVSTSNFTIDGNLVYQTVNNDTGSEYFWFEHGNQTFSIYVWGNNNNVDNIIFDLIKSKDIQN